MTLDKKQEQRNNGKERKNKKRRNEKVMETRGRSKIKKKGHGNRGYETKREINKNSCTSSAFLCLGPRQWRQKLVEF